MGIAIVNGKCIDLNDAVSVRNLMVQKNKITGVGYIPDEDEDNIQVVDIMQSLLLANTFDFIRATRAENLSSYIRGVQAKGVFHVGVLPSQSQQLLDTPDDVSTVLQLAPEIGSLQVIACATKGNDAETLSELSLLHQVGAAGIYFGRIVENEALLKQALTYIDLIGCPIVIGPLTKLKQNAAHLNDGAISFKIGIKGEPVDDEFRLVQMLLSMISEHTRVPVHFLAVSSPQALAYIQLFKEQYPSLTVGVSPFHLSLADDVLLDYNSAAKLNPPLRSKQTVEALFDQVSIHGLDHFTSLHAPVVPEPQPVSFFDCEPEVPTIDGFYATAIDALIRLGVGLDGFQRIFSAPLPFRNFKESQLGLNDHATFIAMKNMAGDASDVEVLPGISLSLQGGVDKVMVDGEFQ